MLLTPLQGNGDKRPVVIVEQIVETASCVLFTGKVNKSSRTTLVRLPSFLLSFNNRVIHSGIDIGTLLYSLWSVAGRGLRHSPIHC